MTYAKDGFMPGELVQLLIEIDNSQCTAPVENVRISVNNTVTMRSQGASTADHRTFFSKILGGVMPGQNLSVFVSIYRATRE